MHVQVLGHVVFKFGDSVGEPSLVRKVLIAAGRPVVYEAERTFRKSVHVFDPDGNEIELYVDA